LHILTYFHKIYKSPSPISAKFTFFVLIYAFLLPPILTMMHLCIMFYAYWTPLTGVGRWAGGQDLYRSPKIFIDIYLKASESLMLIRCIGQNCFDHLHDIFSLTKADIALKQDLKSSA